MKKTYIMPNTKVYNINIKSTILSGSPMNISTDAADGSYVGGGDARIEIGFEDSWGSGF